MATAEEIFGTDLKHAGDLAKTDGSGDLQTVSGLENVKDALLRRLITEPGSIIHRPEYGVGIMRYQNAPATLDTKRSMALKIEEQFLLDPRVEKVLGVSFKTQDLKPDHVTIIVRVLLKGYGETSLELQSFGEI